MNDDTQAKPEVRPARGSWRVILRLVVIVTLAYSIGAILNRVGSLMEQPGKPSGFPQGVIQGALMPMALPNLLVGRDVMIYSTKNTGVGYKLGYTTGVNACGAVFFGFFFWRVNRWRKWAVGRSQTTAKPTCDPQTSHSEP